MDHDESQTQGPQSPALDPADEVGPGAAAAVEAAAEAQSGPTPDGEEQLVEGDSGAEAVELDLAELQARAGRADEYLALAQRAKADFENFRKRMTREVGAAEARGIGRLARELLPALDNLERALAAAETAPAGTGGADGEHHLADGIRLVQAELAGALTRIGIEGYTPTGERFDPELHEAMAQQPVDGAEPGTVVEVYQPGYRLHDTILRPARVVVAA